MIVLDKPGIEIGLQLVNGVVDLFAERHPIELIQQGAMEALADPIRKVMSAFRLNSRHLRPRDPLA